MLAYWLNAYGWRVTLVERFDALRDEGQNIDVRGAGREVLRRTGIEDAVLAANTGERGLEFVDSDGRTVASFPAGEGDSDGGTAEVEILRGKLSHILYERTRDDVEYVFGDQIAALDEGDDGVTVTFRHGPARTFDVVVVAEGLRSRTRARVFPDVDAVRELGAYASYMTIPRTATDNDRWRWLHAGRGRSVMLRPDNVGTTRAGLFFLADVRGLDELDRDGQITILRRTFADVGWQTPRILGALDDAPMYLEALGQACLPAWSHGRVVLAGDAAHCSSPVSGMSTSLAVTGAYVLAGELATQADHRAAFARYELVMRPYVDKAQDLAPGAPRLGNPRSGAERAVLHTVLRAAASPFGRRVGDLVGGLFTPPAEWAGLPTYPTPVTATVGAPATSG